MARILYEVALHTYGKKWLYDPPEHQWNRLNQKGLGKDAAVTLADAQPYHTVVTVWRTSEKVYDNGKPPGPLGAQPVMPVESLGEVATKPAVKQAVQEQLARAGVALPKIVRFFEPYASEGGGETCPHCGATGSVIHRFEVEGGARRGAMSGCVKLFPVSPIAEEDRKLREKQIEYDKKGWKLASWDQDIRDALDDFYAGRIGERTALSRVRDAKARAQAYRASRGRR